jgi:hypothetical protein
LNINRSVLRNRVRMSGLIIKNLGACSGVWKAHHPCIPASVQCSIFNCMMVERNVCFGFLLVVGVGGGLVGRRWWFYKSCWTVFSVLMQFLHRIKTLSPLFDLTCPVIYMEPIMACLSYFPILFIFELHSEDIDFSYTSTLFGDLFILTIVS